jgi:uncharacterized glyoxalase superfamily protein PhnB
MAATYQFFSPVLDNHSMPPGSIIPELGYRDLRAAVGWLCNVFGFRERMRIGNHRVQLLVGQASVVAYALSKEETLVDEAGEQASLPRTGSFRLTFGLMVRVADVDAHHQFVQQRGARILQPPEDYPFGERQYTVEDMGGYRWTLTQSIADVDPAEWGGELLAD